MRRRVSQDYERIYLRSLLVTMIGTLGAYTFAAINPVLFVLGVTGIFVGWWRATRGAKPAPREILHVMTGLVVVAAIVYALRFAFTVESFAFFCVLLVVLKLFDLRTPRDHGQIIVLSLGFLIAAALTSSSMFTGLSVFVMTLLLTRTTLLFRLYASSRLGAERGTTVSARGVLDIRAIQIVVGFCCVVLAVLVFMVMPRNIGGSSLGSWGSPQVMRAGFSSEVELGRPGRITSSPTPIMRVRVRDRDDRELGAPETPAVYLRGAVLEEYRSGRWTRSSWDRGESRLRARSFGQGRTQQVVQDSSPMVWSHEYEISLDRPEALNGYVFSPWLPVEIRMLESDALVSVNERTRSIRLMEDRVSNYKVRVRDTRLDLFPAGVSTREAVPDQQVDGIPERIAGLAGSILDESGIAFSPDERELSDDARAIRAFEGYLREEFAYSLDSEPVPRGSDATEWFLFDRRAGHCEYFASALALMCRASGIPARVVTGFVVAEFNEVSGTYVVRQSNAHAWVEASIGQGVWKIYDGTPTSDFQQIHEGSSSAFDVLAKIYDAVEHEWIRYVVGYDDDQRALVFGVFDPEVGLDAMYDRLSERFAVGRTRLIRAALFWAGVVFVATMTLGLLATLACRSIAFREVLTRIRNSLRIMGLGGSDSEATVLARMIDQRFREIGAPREASCPIGIHQRSTTTDPVLTHAVRVLYAYRYAEESAADHTALHDAAVELSRTVSPDKREPS